MMPWILGRTDWKAIWRGQWVVIYAWPTFSLFLIVASGNSLRIRLSLSLPCGGNVSLTNGFGTEGQPVVYAEMIRPTLWGWDDHLRAASPARQEETRAHSSAAEQVHAKVQVAGASPAGLAN